MNGSVLIVDDMFIGAFDLQLILENNGIEVLGIAHHATEAFAMIASRRPDLVCLDIFLRGSETGLQIAERLRDQNIPFIFISANTYDHIDEDVKRLCPAGYISKPFRDQDVLPVINAALVSVQKSS
ncbi:response regulator [Terrimonas sp. NA20]|uniref:Response regulator n=1 Tax=Terrimonas ginsenosidimutans TaxID=2908004 RepID=A0ABS9KRZ2_9BACT|nr:response regulator [Terrimonas ginsenosidimutans]MCG2615086.1 response regulator [Terrimonas ginsenosidimutans]